MRVDPRLIGTDGDRQQVDGAAFSDWYGRCACRVAEVTKPFAAALEDIGVVLAEIVVLHPRTPVPELKGRDGNGSARSLDFAGFVPAQFDDLAEMNAPKNICGVPGGDDRGFPGQRPQGAQVEMVKVRVRQEHEIDSRQFLRLEGAGDVTLGTDGHGWHANPAPVEENWIGENIETEEIEEHRRVTQPTCRNLIVAPILQLRTVRRWEDRAPAVIDHHLEKAKSSHAAEKNEPGTRGE